MKGTKTTIFIFYIYVLLERERERQASSEGFHAVILFPSPSQLTRVIGECAQSVQAKQGTNPTVFQMEAALLEQCTTTAPQS